MKTPAELHTFELYIGGAHVKPASGLYVSSDNPYSGEIWASVARGNAQDVDRAVAAAQAALSGGAAAQDPPADGPRRWRR